MTRELPKHEPEDDEGNVILEYIQFRGRQTSVTLDDFGIRFQMEQADTPEGVRSFLKHTPLPVASEDAIRQGEAPANAVARPVAEQITDGEISNPLICAGVVCEYPDPDAEFGICGDVFATPEALSGHMSTHYSSGSDENQRDVDSSDSAADTAGDEA